MEEKFLRTRAEREEARQQKSAGSLDAAQDKLEFEARAKSAEQSATRCVAAGDARAAQEHVDSLRALVQEATSNSVLTAHEMAKSNATILRLQGLIDAGRDARGGARAFKFSAKPKIGGAAVVNCQAVAPRPSQPSAGAAEEANVCGFARDRPVFVGPSKAVFLRECEGCEVMIVPVAGSVFISDCTNCRIYVACHQLRLKNCVDVRVYVWCASTPIIECCRGMRFGPYSCWSGLLQSEVEGHKYATHEEWVERVGEQRVSEETKKSYRTVDDFQWLRKTQSPHWSEMSSEQWEMNARCFTKGENSAV